MRYKVTPYIVLHHAGCSVGLGVSLVCPGSANKPNCQGGWCHHGQRLRQDLKSVKCLGTDLQIILFVWIVLFSLMAQSLFISLHISISFVFSFLPNMPFWRGIEKKKQVSALGTQPSSITASILTMIYSSQQTSEPKALTRHWFPCYLYMAWWCSIKGFILFSGSSMGKQRHKNGQLLTKRYS